MGPSVILDKSALEALSVDESVWLEALLDANVVPVFYVEVLGDLEKQARQGQAPEAVVARLAEKTPSNAYPNLHHGQVLLAELAGRRIDMTRRPVISGGDMRRAADGKVGLHVGEFPEQTALWRWQRHDFDAVERVVAKQCGTSSPRRTSTRWSTSSKPSCRLITRSRICSSSRRSSTSSASAATER